MDAGEGIRGAEGETGRGGAGGQPEELGQCWGERYESRTETR